MTTKQGQCGQCWFCREGHPEKCLFPAKKKAFSDETVSGVVSKMTKADQQIMSKNGGKHKGDNGKQKTFGTSYEKCAYSHPSLKIMDGLVVVGGAAEYPLSKEHDIYVSLNGYHPLLPFPWDEEHKEQTIITYPITDMNAPKNPESFKKMITWLIAQGKAGKSIHVGCMGGHGRTGVVLAAMVKEAAGIEDAIEFVRKNYCAKAVESSDQVDFLNKHYGIKKQKGTKSWSGTGSWFGSNTGQSTASTSTTPTGQGTSYNTKFHSYGGGPDMAYPIKPLRFTGNVWGIPDPVKKPVETH